MSQKNLIVIIALILLSVDLQNSQDLNQEDISFNYEFDYSSNIETKNSSNDYLTLISYHGKIETSAYILTDKQELLLLKFNVYKSEEYLNETKSVSSIIIRKSGLVEKIIIDDSVPIWILNLLKGVVNLLNIDEMKESKVEPDVGGECFVKYETMSDQIFRKEKTKCNRTIRFTSPDNKLDSFSQYLESDINIYYVFNQEGTLTSIKSVETHSLEPVLFHDLIQYYRSTTMITFNKITKSRSLINSVSLNDIIRIMFGNSYREVFLVSTPEIDPFDTGKTTSILQIIKDLLSVPVKNKRAQLTVELIKLFRQVTDKSVMTDLRKLKVSRIVQEIIHDASVSCGTKICSEMILEEFERCIKENKNEANRILILLQNTRTSNHFITQLLWKKIPNLSDDLYGQGLQTLSSLLENSRELKFLESMIIDVIEYIKKKLSLCDNELCYLVHLNAIKNSRRHEFQDVLLEILQKSGKYPVKVVAYAFNSIWVLRYDKESELSIQKEVYELIRSKINFFDPYVQYQSIYCLIMLQTETDQLISLFDDLQINNTHFQYFLMKKLKELAKLGIIKNSLFQSKFFLKSNHMLLNYSESDGSKMLVKPLFSTDNSLMDIHFNIIGSDGGLVKHSITDLFLVSTAQENNVFSLSTHMSGLQSYVGSGGNDANEEVEGLLQLSLFGKEIKPIRLFHGTTDLMSVLWNAPSSLESVLRGTFIPIDFQDEIVFQNGIFLLSKYMGSVFLDFSFQLNTNLWYKTASSLLRTTGNAFVTMESVLVSQTQRSDNYKELSIKTGIDFETHINFGGESTENCLSISRPVSKVHFKSHILNSKNNTLIDLTKRNYKILGTCYSITQLMDEMCARF